MTNRSSQATAETWRLFPAAILLFLALPAAAEPALTPHQAEYKVKVSVIGGKLTTRLHPADGGYKATHTIRPTGISRMLSRGRIVESSLFHSSESGIRPGAYAAADSISRDEETVDIQFHWDNREARGTVNGSPVAMPLDDIAHDRVSIQYALMLDLLNGVSQTEYVLFDVDELKPVTVRNIGTKRVKVPAGSFDALGIQHQAENSKRVTTLWCVEELGFLPVIIEQHRKGKLRVRAVLTDYAPQT